MLASACGCLMYSQNNFSIISFQRCQLLGNFFYKVKDKRVLSFRLSKYNRYAISHNLVKHLGDAEANVGRARDLGSERQVDQQLSQLVGSYESCFLFLHLVSYSHRLIICNKSMVTALTIFFEYLIKLRYSLSSSVPNVHLGSRCISCSCR